MMAQAGGHECAHLQGLEGPRHWEGGSQPADLLGARGDVGLWAGAPSPKPTPSYPPGSRWSSTSTRTPSRRGLSCSSSKTKDPVSGVCRGAGQRGSVGAGGAMGVLLVSAPCHLPGWEMLGPWGGAPLPEAGLAMATKATSSAPAPWHHCVALSFALWAPSTCLPSRNLATWDAGWGAEAVLVGLVHRSVGSSPKIQARPQGQQLRDTLLLVHEVGGHGASRRPAWQSPPTQSHLVSVGQDSRVQRPRCSVPAAPGALTTASPTHPHPQACGSGCSTSP